MFFQSYKTFLFGTFLLFFFISCNQKDKLSIEQSASAFDIKQVEASITQSNENLIKAIGSGDSTKASLSFTTNAKIMPGHLLPITGNIAIRHYISTLMNSGLKSCDIKTINIWGDSSIVAEEGTYAQFDSTQKQTDKGEYIVLWKQEAGNWKMFRDIWTSDLKLQEPAMIDSIK